VLVHLTEAQAQSGSIDAARATVARALELDPTSPQALALKRRLK
jgi:uncharacterized protein HemY